MNAWVIITSEYPPAAGGVSDYTRQLAVALARAGDEVDVWTPRLAEPYESDAGVTVHPLPDRFGPASWQVLGRALNQNKRPITLLLQYVPQGFGMRVMNLPFLLWLATRREPLWLMVHEAVFPFKPGQPLKHHVLAAVTRAMLGVIGSRADRLFVSVPAWQPYLERYARLRCDPELLPVPSNLPTTSRVGGAELRERLGIPPTAKLLVHFGTYSGVVSAPLRAAVPLLLSDHSERWLLLLGRNSERFRDELVQAHPRLDSRLIASGELPSQQAADALSCADLAVFAYPDGVSGRRGSLMAALALGVPVVGTQGASTESRWREHEAVALVNAWDTEALADTVNVLLADPIRRARLGARGREAYASGFSIERTVQTLRIARAGQRSI